MATREETKRMIEVMQHYVDGGLVEVSSRKDVCAPAETPIWNFGSYQYRMACECPTYLMDFLDAQSMYQWVAVDADGMSCFSREEPVQGNGRWSGCGHAPLMAIDLKGANWRNTKYKRGARNAV